jgi:hypothetical protein
MLKIKRISKAQAPSLDTRTVLYCDFDGVLHPDEVYSPQSEIAPRLEPPGRGHHLFENAPILEAALTDYPRLALVLSTSWCQRYGLEYATKQLPPAIQARVIGTTFDPAYPHFWRMAHWTRYNQIVADVACRNPTQWLALDDVALGWPNVELHRLVLTTSPQGLASPMAQSQLQRRLQEVFGVVAADSK